MCNFFKTVSCFYKNPFINPYKATLRHISWQIRKIFNNFPCEIEIEGFKVIVKNKSIANGCGGLLNAMGYYDPNNMYFLDEVFYKGVYNEFLDIGANIGIYSLIASHKSEAKVSSFEPHPFTYGLLIENISVNKLQCRITPYQIALSNFEGHVNFTDDPGSTINRIIDKSVENQKHIRISVTTGDNFCKMHAVKPEVLKIDVEGHENNVISGFRDCLADVKIVIVECKNINETTMLLYKTHGFIGPYKIDYRNRLFSKSFSSYEDNIFLNPNTVGELKSLSFTLH